MLIIKGIVLIGLIILCRIILHFNIIIIILSLLIIIIDVAIRSLFYSAVLICHSIIADALLLYHILLYAHNG